MRPANPHRSIVVLVVDSSVWIDYFSGNESPPRDVLRRVLRDGDIRVVVPDLVLFEVLRGFRLERELRTARGLMESLSLEEVASPGLVLEAVQHYRSLRAAGVTVRNAIDVLIATFCIVHDYTLLHRDRDYHGFEQRGLRVWRQ